MSVELMTNAAQSPLRFEVDGRELIGVLDSLDASGHDLLAIYHSHTRTPPFPSQTDVNFARAWPGLEWIIVGLAGDEPEVRSYAIVDGHVQEQVLEIE